MNNSDSQNAPLSAEETYRLERRKAIQAYVNAYRAYPAMIIDAMQQYGVDAAEITEAMVATINMTHYLRKAGVPDGFMGLKVWSPAEVQNYLDFVKAHSPVHGWGFMGVTDPIEAQDVLDRMARRKAAMPAFQIPWEGNWRLNLSIEQAAEEKRRAGLDSGNTVILS
ncbi:MAG: hypothetical protein WC829_09845 [Hyphomicrobium sp.]|jgi:hypothetical protein